MPLALEFDDPATFRVCASGQVTFDEVQEFRARILADPRLCCGTRMLVDGRDVRGAPSALELRTIAADMRPMLEKGLGPIAIVTSSQMVYGVARMFATFAELVNANISPFRDMGDAERWLAAQPAGPADGAEKS